jgi:hypothetical protein
MSPRPMHPLLSTRLIKRRAVGASLPDCGLSTRILFCVFYIPVLYCVEYNPPYINVTSTNAPPVETRLWHVSICAKLFCVVYISNLYCVEYNPPYINVTPTNAPPCRDAPTARLPKTRHWHVFTNKILRIIYYNDVRCRYITY